MRIETDLDGKTVGAIERHYFDAKEKHPYFCDKILYEQWSREELMDKLRWDRRCLEESIREKRCTMPHVLACEVSEMVVEILDGNTAAAVDECYDCIAVLLRVIDVLEGRQSLGGGK